MELTQQELINIIKEAYRHGFSSYEMVEAGLESFDAQGYAEWVVAIQFSIKNK